MATYTAIYSVHKTLTGTTPDRVTLSWRTDSISILNRGTVPLYVLVGDGSGYQVNNSGRNGVATNVENVAVDAANEGQDTHIIMPGIVGIFDFPTSGSVSVAGNGNKYSVLATELASA